MEGLDEIKLIKRVRNGDEQAFKTLYYVYLKRLRYFVLKLTKSEYITDEILQEVFIKIWTNRESLDAEKSFSGFIFRITRNLVINHWKKEALREANQKDFYRGVTMSQNQTENLMATNEYLELATKIINDLPPQKKSIFLLSRHDEKSHLEIAEHLGISTKTVRNHLWKALELVKTRLRAETGIVQILATVLIPHIL